MSLGATAIRRDPGTVGFSPFVLIFVYALPAAVASQGSASPQAAVIVAHRRLSESRDRTDCRKLRSAREFIETTQQSYRNQHSFVLWLHAGLRVTFTRRYLAS